MSKQIAIIGSEEERVLTAALLAEHKINDVVLVTPDEAMRLINKPEPQENYFRITDIPRVDIYGEKEFVCKGLHEYRRVETKEGNLIKVEWICQCGRKTTD